ncbi:hypothetical protein, partial [Psychrobacter sp. TB20-MNA-CIBAN-0197]|uniref:hypothetical protein n=1 Tax=Psychrobacter sp. TB20-MNA-CIBAN-0197 TaxID=3140453 RepID=UPI003330BEB7
SIELKGQWGFSALQQLIATERLFFQRSRVPIKAQSGQALSFSWEQDKDLSQLVIKLEQTQNWALLKSTPPTYLDLDHLKAGRLRTPLSA